MSIAAIRHKITPRWTLRVSTLAYVGGVVSIHLQAANRVGVRGRIRRASRDAPRAGRGISPGARRQSCAPGGCRRGSPVPRRSGRGAPGPCRVGQVSGCKPQVRHGSTLFLCRATVRNGCLGLCLFQSHGRRTRFAGDFEEALDPLGLTRLRMRRSLAPDLAFRAGQRKGRAACDRVATAVAGSVHHQHAGLLPEYASLFNGSTRGWRNTADIREVDLV